MYKSQKFLLTILLSGIHSANWYFNDTLHFLFLLQPAKVVKEVSDLRTSIENRISAIESDLAAAKKTCASNLETILKERREVEDKRPNVLVFGQS